jgi:hypothetical protein
MTATFLFGTSTSKPKSPVFPVGDRNVPLNDGNIVVNEYNNALATGKFCGRRPQHRRQKRECSVQRQKCSVQGQECRGVETQVRVSQTECRIKLRTKS